jgi:hypothetical protein
MFFRRITLFSFPHQSAGLFRSPFRPAEGNLCGPGTSQTMAIRLLGVDRGPASTIPIRRWP